MKISFLTSGHIPFDDRIFFHMAKSTVENGDEVEINSSIGDLTEIKNNIQLNCFNGNSLSKRDKIKVFKSKLASFNPDIIICSEPITIVAAKEFVKGQKVKSKIVYDITEWYPSKKNIGHLKFPVKQFQFLKYLIFNLISASMSDAFIFGEWYKSRIYRLLFPNKPYNFTAYYPDLNYLKPIKSDLSKSLIKLSYSGKMNKEKGFQSFIKVVDALSKTDDELKIKVKIIGWFDESEKEENKALLSGLEKNVTVDVIGIQPFEDFLLLVNDTDIFIDLRSVDYENQRCLPIKLFYYTALHRPVIYSDLKAIRKEVDIDKFGFLVDPDNTKLIVELIRNYIDDKNLYEKHCRTAGRLAGTDYNWGKIKDNFITFLKDLHFD
jgi:glycosyltransferase involved in cell wall biosynthesis